MSERLAVIGDPIAHSLSPAMQTAALRRAGLAWSYTAERVPALALSRTVARLRDEGFRGFNVTIPHKAAIRPLLDREDPLATRVGAVNTVVREGGELIGYNTDVDGFAAALHRLDPPPGTPAVVFGAGGAARAVLLALMQSGMWPTVVGRDLDRARSAARVAGAATRAMTYDDPALAGVLAAAGAVVNATPLGMGRLAGRSPLPPGAALAGGCVAIDLVYGGETAFVRQARARGLRVTDGLQMLIEQGALAFTLWTGLEADRDEMRRACLRVIQDRAAC